VRRSSLKAAVWVAAVGILTIQCGGRGAGKQAAGGISPALANAPIAVEVQISQYKFSPDSIHVAVGSVVRWTNKDNIGHTVTFTAADTGARRPIHSRAELLQLNRPSELYSSKMLQENQSFTAKFDRPGRFGYICDPHPYMKAIVVVE